jgi:hypothetical protein
MKQGEFGRLWSFWGWGAMGCMSFRCIPWYLIWRSRSLSAQRTERPCAQLRAPARWHSGLGQGGAAAAAALARPLATRRGRGSRGGDAPCAMRRACVLPLLGFSSRVFLPAHIPYRTRAAAGIGGASAPPAPRDTRHAPRAGAGVCVCVCVCVCVLVHPRPQEPHYLGAFRARHGWYLLLSETPSRRCCLL